MRLSLITAPTVEPITRQQAKDYLRVRHALEDDDIDVLIVAGRERIEFETDRQLLEATWELRLDDFPCAGWIQMPRPNLLGVTSITYVDATGTLQTWAASQYQVSTTVGPHGDFGRVAPVYGISWPSVRPQTFDAVKIRFTAGYGDEAADVPAPIRMANKLMVAALYRKREDEIEQFRSGVAPMPSRASRLIRGYWKRPTQ